MILARCVAVPVVVHVYSSLVLNHNIHAAYRRTPQKHDTASCVGYCDSIGVHRQCRGESFNSLNVLTLNHTVVQELRDCTFNVLASHPLTDQLKDKAKLQLKVQHDQPEAGLPTVEHIVCGSGALRYYLANLPQPLHIKAYTQ